MADSLAKEVELPCSGNRDECHANSWLLGRLITLCVGISVAVAVAWQSYGDIARQIVATSCEQFSSIAPRAAPGDSLLGLSERGCRAADLRNEFV